MKKVPYTKLCYPMQKKQSKQHNRPDPFIHHAFSLQKVINTTKNVDENNSNAFARKAVDQPRKACT